MDGINVNSFALAKCAKKIEIIFDDKFGKA
jgi:hypothetical protein